MDMPLPPEPEEMLPPEDLEAMEEDPLPDDEETLVPPPDDFLPDEMAAAVQPPDESPAQASGTPAPPPDNFLPDETAEAVQPPAAAGMDANAAPRPDNPLSAPQVTDPSLTLFNREAEEAVLGAILINQEAYYDVSEFLQPDDFYIDRNRWVWEAIHKIKSDRRDVDLLTVSAELEAAGHLAELGGQAYLLGLANAVPSSLHVRDYARIVEATAIRRRLLNAANQIARKAHDQRLPVETLLTDSEKEIFNVSERRLSNAVKPIKLVLADYFDEVEERAKREDEIVGVPTGFIDLDKLLNGLQPSDLIIIAGRPGQGKTGLLLNIAKNAAMMHKKRVAVFSLEMSNQQLVQRLVSQETGINSQRLRSGRLQDDEWPLFIEAVDKLSQTQIFLDDTPAITPLQLRTKCRRLYMEHGLDLVIIDYLQLMGGDTRTDNRVQEVSYISRNLKILARELNVPVIAAAQLSRAVEQRSDKHPQLSDLRESGSLEQDADIVMFIYRDEYYNEDTEKKNVAEIMVAKHRNGPTATVELIFRKHLTRFENAATHVTHFEDA